MTSRKLHQIYNLIKSTDFNSGLFKCAGNLFIHFRGKFRKDAMKPIPHPYTLMLELTNKCNLHCVTCPREYGYGRQMSIGNMSTELAKSIIDQSYKYLMSIGLTGMGETLFAANLLEVAKYVKSKKKSILIFISTNANMPDFIERVTPVLPYINTVQISTDGVGKVYEDVRHGASFKLLDENLTQILPLSQKHKVDLMFNMVITKINYSQMADVLEYAAAKGVKYVNFTYFNLASVTSVTTDYYQFFSSDEFRREVERLKAAAAKHPEVKMTGIDFPGNPGIHKCQLMWNHFQINHDGEVPPCCAKPFSKEYSFGNVTSTPLMEVLNSRRALEFRQCCVNGTPHPFCSKCHFLEL